MQTKRPNNMLKTLKKEENQMQVMVTVATRLGVNIQQQEPLLQYYETKDLMRPVEGEAGIDGVFKEKYSRRA